MADTRHVLMALQYADSAFPSGGFAFSQGLEAASQLQARLRPFDLSDYIELQIRHRWASSDRVALIRSHRLANDLVSIIQLDHEVEASTMMEPLRAGSRRNGMALLTAHNRLATPNASEYRQRVREGQAPGHIAVVQGLVWRSSGLTEDMAVALSGYQCVMSLATAAIRLGLAGAIEAQRIVRQYLPLIDDVMQSQVADDCPLSSFAPLAELAVLLHAGSEQRLFSN